MNGWEDSNKTISIFPLNEISERIQSKVWRAYQPKFTHSPKINNRLQIDQVMNQDNKRQPRIVIWLQRIVEEFMCEWIIGQTSSFFFSIYFMHVHIEIHRDRIKGLASDYGGRNQYHIPRERERERERTFVIGWWERKKWRFEGRIWNSGCGVECEGQDNELHAFVFGFYLGFYFSLLLYSVLFLVLS